MKRILLLLTAVLAVGYSFAFRIEAGRSVVISRPVYEDIYIAGGTVTINAPVYADLIIAGGTVNINDSVFYDIIVAGGNVTFNGYVADDIRCAGGRLHVLKNTGGDLVITGGEVTVDKEVIINGGLLISGGNITCNGTVKNNIKAAAGYFIFNGTAEKIIDIRAGRIDINGTVNGASVLAAGKLEIGGNASFNNDIRYWTKSGSADFKSSIKKGKATYDPSLEIETGRWYYLGYVSILGLLWYIGMAYLMIAIIQYLFSATMHKAGDMVFNATFRSLGVGLLFFTGVPVAALIMFVIIIGVPVGVLLLLAYITLLLLATVITSIVAANWINNRFNYKWKLRGLTFSALGIFILLKILSFIPFFGWLIMIIAVFMAFGGILLSVRWRKKTAIEEPVK